MATGRRPRRSPSPRTVFCISLPRVSAHLLASSPTCHWLEYADWASPLLQDPLRIEYGMAIISDKPGNNLRWDPDAVASYRLY